MFNLIKLSLWDQGSAIASKQIFEEMKQQAIAALPASNLSRIDMPSELKKEWKLYAIRQLSVYSQNTYEQSIIPITVPYAILKGTSASQYYPHPEYRTMGDIDIMTRREDLDMACQQLLDNGYCIIKELNREITLVKNGTIVELHRRFATLNDPDNAKYLDDLIIENITPSHVLPDPVNGLVLLEHIDQHMEGGIGLRQVIDWMMFVDKCLPDDQWPEFERFADRIGLKKLAIVTTRMCELYLGLPHREWSSRADESLCEQLMDYVLSSGNFGNKKTSDADISENAIAFSSTPKTALKLLQKQGMKNWKAAQKHPILKPFAWIYQSFRYASKGLRRDHAISRLRAEYAVAKRRVAMFDELGVKTESKGAVVYKDGKYVKE